LVIARSMRRTPRTIRLLARLVEHSVYGLGL
jgi:hypothetical protein